MWYFKDNSKLPNMVYFKGLHSFAIQKKQLQYSRIQYWTYGVTYMLDLVNIPWSWEYLTYLTIELLDHKHYS